MKTIEHNQSEIQKFIEKNLYYILGGFLLLFFLLDYFFIMRKQIDTLNTLTPKLGILNQDIDEIKNNIQKSEVYRAQILRLKDQLQKVGYQIPLKEEVSLVLDGISRIASQNKIKIDQMIPGKGPQEILQKEIDEKYSAFPILVEAQGGYHDIGRFIDQLEKDSIYKSIASLSIESDSKDSSHLLVRLTIKTILLEKIDPAAEKAEKPKK